MDITNFTPFIQWFLLGFFIKASVITILSFYQCKYKKNAFGLTPWLFVLGMYVWGDGTIFGPFWALVSLLSLVSHDFVFFLLCVSVFWLVRSSGETLYWFLEQFTQQHRNPVKTLAGHTIYHNEAIWFIYQIQNQVITIITIITTVYLFHIWLG